MKNEEIPDELYGYPAGVWKKDSQHLSRYFWRERHRYPDMVGGLKAIMHREAMARKGEKRQQEKLAKNEQN